MLDDNRPVYRVLDDGVTIGVGYHYTVVAESGTGCPSSGEPSLSLQVVLPDLRAHRRGARRAVAKLNNQIHVAYNRGNSSNPWGLVTATLYANTTCPITTNREQVAVAPLLRRSCY